MRIEYPDRYLGKKIRVYCDSGMAFTGTMMGYCFDYDDDGNELTEIDIDCNYYHVIGAAGMSFVDTEITKIEVLDEEKK